MIFALFFFTATATTEIYTLSLHDALPISPGRVLAARQMAEVERVVGVELGARLRLARDAAVIVPFVLAVALDLDRKSTRLNSSHSQISYAVFCLKKKKNTQVRRQSRGDVR